MSDEVAPDAAVRSRETGKEFYSLQTPEHERLVRAANRSARISRALGVLAIVLVLVMVSIVLIYQVNAVNKISRIADQNRVGVERILDCTSPGGKCAQRGQAATARAVKEIVDQIAALQNHPTKSGRVLLADNQKIIDALRVICAARNVACPSLGP